MSTELMPNHPDKRIRPTTAELGQLLFLTPKALAACRKLGFGPSGLRAFYVPSASMEPTLRGPRNSAYPNDADRLIVDTVKSLKVGPGRGEIWMFTPPCETSGPDTHFIQRVIGCPGDLVEVVPPRITVDGEDIIRFMGSQYDELNYDSRRPIKLSQDGSVARVPDYNQELLWVVCTGNHRLTRKRGGINLDGKRILDGSKWRKRSLARIGASPLVRGVGIADVSGQLRLVAVRGERLEFVPGHVLVNGVRLEEPCIEGPPEYGTDEVQLVQDQYYLLGDFRNNCNDSHHFGPVKREAFFGRAIFRYFPPKRFGPLS